MESGSCTCTYPVAACCLAVEEFRAFYRFIRALSFLKGCLILSGILCAQCQDSGKTDEESGVPAHSARICCVCHVPKQCCHHVSALHPKAIRWEPARPAPRGEGVREQTDPTWGLAGVQG